MSDYLRNLIATDVKTFQRVQLREAKQTLETVAGQAERLDVTELGVQRVEGLNVVVAQVHVGQFGQVLEVLHVLQLVVAQV